VIIPSLFKGLRKLCPCEEVTCERKIVPFLGSVKIARYFPEGEKKDHGICGEDSPDI